MAEGIDGCKISKTAFVAESAILQGDVTVEENASVWHNAVVRGDRGPIVIGKGSNVQDNATIHLDAPFPVRIGENVTIGHGAIVHGCTIGDGSLIGMGAIIMNGAHIGKNCIIAAGALVTQGQEVPDGSLVMGVPGKACRQVTEEELERSLQNAGAYVEEARKAIKERDAASVQAGNSYSARTMRDAARTKAGSVIEKRTEKIGYKPGLLFDVPEDKKLRVIIDTDAACEADDPFAIVQALLSPKLIVKGIVAEHFHAPGSMERSFEEIRTILDCMDLKDVPALRGQEGPMGQESPEGQGFALSEGVRFLIDEAMKTDEKPLYVLCQGAITNVAAAMKACPEIINRMTVIWIGTHGEAPRKAPFREFNAGNDVVAANYVLSCGGDVWIVPSTVYGTIHIGIAELQRRILPCGRIGEHLFRNLVNYNNSESAGWTKGESWSLGDSPAIALALNPDCGHYHYALAPYVAEDTSSVERLEASRREGARECFHSRPLVRMYDDIDSRYVLEDLIAKLELAYGN